MQPLVSAIDLQAFPGSPFDEEQVVSAGASVRAEAGWHIAPVESETITVEACGPLLVLPSLRVVEITAVRDVTTGTPTVVTGWRRRPVGLYVPGWWFDGLYEVDLSHGFDEVPAELLPVIARRVGGGSIAGNVSQRSQTSGPYSESVTYREVGRAEPVVARYSVHTGIA